MGYCNLFEIEFNFSFPQNFISNLSSSSLLTNNKYSPYTIDLCPSVIVQQIVFSEISIYILTIDGQVYVIGSNANESLNSPTLMEGLEGVIVTQIAAHCEGKHIMVLSSKNEVYSWGLGDSGRLGHGDTQSKDVPTKISALSDKQINNVFCGSSYSAGKV